MFNADIEVWVAKPDAEMAGYYRSKIDPILMRTVDVMLAFPPLLFLLVLITGAGTGTGVLIVGVAAIQAPGIKIGRAHV